MATYTPRLKDGLLANKVFGKVPGPVQRGSAGLPVVTAQEFLNIVAGPNDPKLVLDGQFGPKTEAAVRRYQQRAKLPVTGNVTTAVWWALRRDVWGVTAWKPVGVNKYTKKAVDRRGLAFETARLEDAIHYAFGYGLSPNVMVDRNARGSSRLSDHAKGLALDLMTWYLAGKGMAEGHKLLIWLASPAAAEYGITYALFDYMAWYRGKDKAPRLMTKARVLYVLRRNKVPSWLNTGQVNYKAPGWAHETHVHISLPDLSDWVAPSNR